MGDGASEHVAGTAHAVPPRVVAITGADGTLGTRVAGLLAGRDLRRIDRARGHEVGRARTYAALLEGCDAVVHTAALHPLVAPAATAHLEYEAANVAPFAELLMAVTQSAVRRVVLVSSTSVWNGAAPGHPARFLDEDSAADGDDGYARSKLACEDLARGSGLDCVVVRLARFARRGDPEDAVRLLYRAIDPDDAAGAVVAALDRARPGSLYAISGPTPFRPEDAAELTADPGAVIRRRTGGEPLWVPKTISSVVLSARAERELGWAAAHPSPLLRAAPSID